MQLYEERIELTYKKREQGTGNREQIRNTHLYQFRASVKKKMFLKDA
jgi:hypothetical protein